MYIPLDQVNGGGLQYGDLLIKHGHVRFFEQL